mmetsp:Transcript_33686/g.114398  ORF Transcript_33686/g.114398 Transcript_33686/m.114398 type:complete len:309 (-) Transcript_33686:971-1897(-)
MGLRGVDGRDAVERPVGAVLDDAVVELGEEGDVLLDLRALRPDVHRLEERVAELDARDRLRVADVLVHVVRDDLAAALDLEVVGVEEGLAEDDVKVEELRPRDIFVGRREGVEVAVEPADDLRVGPVLAPQRQGVGPVHGHVAVALVVERRPLLLLLGRRRRAVAPRLRAAEAAAAPSRAAGAAGAAAPLGAPRRQAPLLAARRRRVALDRRLGPLPGARAPLPLRAERLGFEAHLGQQVVGALEAVEAQAQHVVEQVRRHRRPACATVRLGGLAHHRRFRQSTRQSAAKEPARCRGAAHELSACQDR